MSELGRQNPTDVQKEPVKIKYISSPVFVKASNASEFRAIVQELTGKNAKDRSFCESSNSMHTNHGNPR
jgi:hypothetical protein